MGWATDAVRALAKGEQVMVRPRGGSMRGRIEDGQPVTLGPVEPAAVRAGDVVLVRWKGGVLLHLVKEATAHRVLIGNNVGKVNGWASRRDVLGRVVRVHPLGS
jgi:Peptidase S24-like